jgi:ABC-type sugar transport system substrate-binding protein
MKVTRHVVVPIAVLSLTLALAGCNREGADAAGPTGSGASQGSRVAVVLKTSANPFWVNVADGAQAAGQRTGADVTVQAAQNESDIAGQTSLLGNLSGGGYDCVAVAPITGTNLVQPLAQIAQSGATIVNIDSPVDPGAAEAAGITIATFISSNNQVAGRMAGEQMGRLLGGRGTVAVLAGLSGDANSNARTGGFTEAAQAAGLAVVQTVAADWDREKALNGASDILRANPDLGGIYAANDTMALGAVQAARNAGNSTVRVIGTDGDQTALESIRDGGLAATVSQYPYVAGLMGVEACQAAAAGRPLPERVDSPLALISAENVDQALSSYPQPFQPFADPFADLLNG